MKIARTIGLAVLAAMALMASVGAGSALGVETTLCKSQANRPYCSAEDRQPSGTSLQAGSTDLRLKMTFIGIPVEVKCPETSLQGKTSKETGNPLPLDVSSIGVAPGGETTCYYKNIYPCSLKGLGSAPHTGSIAWTDHSNGTLTVGTSEAKVRFELECEELGIEKCQMESIPTLKVTGGEQSSIISANELAFTILPGGVCPKSPKFSATYTVSSPVPLNVARGDMMPSNTALCKKPSGYCEATDLYSKGTEIKAVSTDLAISGESTFIKKFSCEKVDMTVTTGASYGEPLPLDVSAFAMYDCKVNYGSTPCSMEPIIPLFSGGLTKSGYEGGGWWSGSGGWRANCESLGLKCEFTAPEGSEIELDHTLNGEDKVVAQFIVGNLPLKTGGICPSNPTLSATFNVTSPSPLWVTHAVT